MTITLPDPPGDPADGPPDLTDWLHSLAGSTLPGLLRQADPQHVMEYSLALIAVLNEVGTIPTGPGKPPLLVSGQRCPLTALCPQYEQALPVLAEPDPRQELRAQIRKNITETLVSLRVNTVDDIQQVAAALAQCTVGWTQPHGSPAPHTPRAPSSAKPARLHAPQGGPRGSGHKEHWGGVRSGDAVLCPPGPVVPSLLPRSRRPGWAGLHSDGGMVPGEASGCC